MTAETMFPLPPGTSEQNLAGFLRKRIVDGQVPFGLILGIALILRTRRRQRLGDLAARTMVVQDLGP